MSFPLEKQPARSPESTSRHSQSLTDWERFEAMDDEDIIFDEDNPEIQAGDLQQGGISISGITPTREQIIEAKRQILEYINRPRRKK